jgi:hypothetical protein
MIEKRIQVEEGVTLTLAEMTQDVAISGWDEADVLVRLESDNEEDLTIEQAEAGPAISARAACELRVPTSLPVVAQDLMANLTAEGLDKLDVQEVHGNARLSGIDDATFGEVYGNLRAEAVPSLRVSDTTYGNATLQDGTSAELQNVRGNLYVGDLDSLHAGRISGNLMAKELDGPLAVEGVGGNATLKGIGGAVALEKVGGNLAAKDLRAGAKVAKIGGNLALNGEMGTGYTYQFKVGGNGVIRLSDDASAHLTLSAKGQIRSSLTLAGSERQGNTLTGTVGEGGAEIVVEAGGNILLGTTGSALGAGLGEEISRQIEESLRAIDLQAVGEQISAEMERAMSQLRVKLESVDWDNIGRRTQRSVERAMERMQRDIDRMTEKAARRQEKLERLAERAVREKERLERSGQRWSGRQQWQTAGRYYTESEEPDEPKPSLDQERLAILKMVEEGKISSEEAEKLLDALE